MIKSTEVRKYTTRIVKISIHAVLPTLPDNPGESRFWTVISRFPDQRMKSPG